VHSHYTHRSSALPVGPLGDLPSLSLTTKGSWIHLWGEGRQACRQLSDASTPANEPSDEILLSGYFSTVITDIARHPTNILISSRINCLKINFHCETILYPFAFWTTQHKSFACLTENSAQNLVRGQGHRLTCCFLLRPDI